jgi:hypothetical protein
LLDILLDIFRQNQKPTHILGVEVLFVAAIQQRMISPIVTDTSHFHVSRILFTADFPIYEFLFGLSFLFTAM